MTTHTLYKPAEYTLPPSGTSHSFSFVGEEGCGHAFCFARGGTATPVRRDASRSLSVQDECRWVDGRRYYGSGEVGYRIDGGFGGVSL